MPLTYLWGTSAANFPVIICGSLVIAGCPAAYHKLLVLVGKVVESHFAKEELLADLIQKIHNI